jgi:aldose 1-epimerase
MSLEQVTITDPTTGSKAVVLVGFGFNCYQFHAMVGGAPVDVLWSHPEFETGKQRPSHSGIPLLFPYPGRLKGKTLTFEGRTYPLDGDDTRGNAIHGYVLNRPWKTVEQTASRVVGEFRASVVDPEILKRWPADFLMRVSYELSGATLKSQITITNPDDKKLPIGFGSHPYFRVPLGPVGAGEAAGSGDDCIVTVPVRNYWELVDMLPSGKKLPADGSHDLAKGMRFADTKFDTVFTDVEFTGNRSTSTIADPKSGRKLAISFDDKFSQCVVYNPPHRQAICIEPYTCLPDQFTMAERGIISAPATLAPGATFTCAYEIGVS